MSVPFEPGGSAGAPEDWNHPGQRATSSPSARRPSTEGDRRELLEVAYPPLDDIAVYMPMGEDRLLTYRAGDGLVFSDRVVRHRNYLFPIPVAAHGPFQLRIDSESSLIVPVAIWTQEAFSESDRFRLLLQGFFFGAAAIIAAYNFFLFLTLREPSYLFYVLHVSLSGFYYFIWGGFALEWLWPDLPVVNNRSNPVVVGLASAAGFLFARSLLSTRTLIPRLDRVIELVILLCLTCVALGATGFYRESSYLLIVAGLFAAFVMPLIGIHLLLRGIRVVRYLLVSWGISLILIAANVGRVLLLIPANFLTMYEGIQVASVIQFVLLSLALADRFRLLRKEREAAQAASAAKTIFLSNMSHEIRTPLNAVIGMAELLDESELPEPQRTYAHSLVTAGRNLLNLVNDVLDISKIESGRKELRLVSFRPVNLVESLERTIVPSAERKGLITRWEVDPAMPDRLTGDEDALRQVLLNLLSNAVKFTETGELELSLRSIGEVSNRTRVRFEVRDTGLGISRGDQDRIFEVFTQADDSRSRGYGGTGLGLAISRRLVELMGGRLQVESEPGRGSRFYFELELSPPIPAGPTGPDSSGANEAAVRDVAAGGGNEGKVPVDSAQSEAHTPARPLRILLAEDNEENRILVRAFLKDQGHTLVEAHDGLEAERLFLAEPFDVVLMDVQMPRLDGLEAARRIRRHEDEGNSPRRDRTPIITLTAYALKEEVDRSLQAGCDEHLTKPIRRPELLAALARHARDDS